MKDLRLDAISLSMTEDCISMHMATTARFSLVIREDSNLSTSAILSAFHPHACNILGAGDQHAYYIASSRVIG